MDRIVELLLPVVSLLEDIHLGRDVQVNQNTTIGNWNASSSKDAFSLLKSVTFPFIISLVVRHILDLTKPLTVKLQRKEIDIIESKGQNCKFEVSSNRNAK